MQTTRSEALLKQARHLFPGGVNSPVRAFGSVGGTPRFMARGKGAQLWDVDGNAYLDYVLSWGPLILGHAHPDVVQAICESAENGSSYGTPTPLENELAELIIATMPSIEQLRFVNSGTEACMSALRLARAYTKRDKIIKLDGNYHGHADMLLVQAGSGVATLGLPDSAGVPSAATEQTLTAPYNDLVAVAERFARHPAEIAAVIVEPVAGNMGFILPSPSYLHGLRQLCHDHGALLIMDEVMTGFRVALGGAQALFDISADLTCLGKVIGGGLPVGAYGGRREIMAMVAPLGPMYQAGTLSGNPLAMSAGIATLRILRQEGVFEQICRRTQKLAMGIAELFSDEPFQTGWAGTMFGFYFLREAGMTIRDYATAKQCADVARFGRFFHAALNAGLYFAPSQFEAGFVSLAHGEAEIEMTLARLAAIKGQF